MSERVKLLQSLSGYIFAKTNLTLSYEFIFHLVKTKDYFYNPTLTELSSKSKPSLPPRHRNIKIHKSS